MDFSLLTSYVTFARHLNFTEAAKELCITQPTLSKQIATIEKEVGRKLVDRSRQQLSLTHAGLIYLEGANAILSRHSMILSEIASISKDGRGLLLVTGFVFGSANEAILSFKKKHPLIHLKIASGNIPGKIRTILEHEADICLGAWFPQLEYPGLRFHHLDHLPLCIVVDEDHRLAKYDKVTVSDLKNEQLLMHVEDSSDLLLCVSGMFAAHGVSPNIEIRYTSSFIELLANLQGAVLLWVLNCPVPGAHGTRFTMVEIEDFVCDYGAWYCEDSSNPAVPLFLQELSAVFSLG